MTTVELCSCVRPVQMINSKKFLNRITPLLNGIPDNIHKSLIQACRSILHSPACEPCIVALWGFGPPDLRDRLLDIMTSLGIIYFIASQVQDQRFECLCWSTKAESLSTFFDCFAMGIDFVTIDIQSEFAMYESALKRIEMGTIHKGSKPIQWPQTFQDAHKIGIIHKTVALNYTPENFLSIHMELRRNQQRVVALYDRNLTQDEEIRRLRMQIFHTANNLNGAIEQINRGHQALQILAGAIENTQPNIPSTISDLLD